MLVSIHEAARRGSRGGETGEGGPPTEAPTGASAAPQAHAPPHTRGGEVGTRPGRASVPHAPPPAPVRGQVHLLMEPVHGGARQYSVLVTAVV